MKMTLAALTCLALPPAAAVAYTVKAPVPGTVSATTYTASGAFRGAMDISSGRCNYWGIDTGLAGALFWDVTIRTTGVVCAETQNEAKHTSADGWTYRIWHFIKTANSYDRTCDRCQIGNDSGMVHIQVDKSGTLDSSWYSAYTVKGEAVDRTETLGVLD